MKGRAKARQDVELHQHLDKEELETEIKLEPVRKVHKSIKDRLKIPMKNDKRSLNIASSVAIILAESLRQNELI